MKRLKEYARFVDKKVKEDEDNLFEKMRVYVEAKDSREKIREKFWDAVDVFFGTRNLLKRDQNFTTGNLTSEIEQQWTRKSEMYTSERDYAHEISFYLNIAKEAVEVRIFD